MACALSFSILHANRALMHAVLPLVRTDFGLGYFSASLLAASYDLGYLLTLIPVGYLSLGLAKRIPIYYGLAIIVVTSLTVAIYAPSYLLLVFYRVLAGVGFSFYFTAGSSLLSDHFPPAERGLAYGIHSIGASVGRVYGSAFFGLVAVNMGWHFSFGVFTVLVVFVGVLVFIIFNRARGTMKWKNQGNNVWMMVTRFLSQRDSRTAIILNAFGSVFIMTFLSFLTLYLTQVNGLSVKTASLLLGLTAVVAIGAAPLFGWISDRLGRRKIVVMIYCLSSFISLSLPFTQGFPFLVALCLGLGLSGVPIFPVLMSYFTESHPHHATTLGIGIYNSIGVGAGFVGTLFFGLVADLINLKAVYFGLGALMIGGAVLALRLMKEHRSDRLC